DRQRNSLKRQASKARRYIELRNRMRDILSAVFSTRAEMLIDQQDKVEISLALMGNEGKQLEQEIERLNALVHQRRTDVTAEERKLEETRGRRSEIELEHEKTIQRIERLQDQIKALEDRKETLAGEKTRALAELERNVAEANAKTAQLAGIDQEKQVVEESVTRAGAAVAECVERRNEEERAIAALPQQLFETIGREAKIRNERLSRKETSARVSAQIERLEREEAEAKHQAAGLEQQLNTAREEYASQQTGFGLLKSQLAQAEHEY